MLGALLADRGHAFELVAIGGGGLLLLGIIERPTKDLDALALVEGDDYKFARPLPAALAEAVADTAAVLGLAADWLNAGPADQLIQGLPSGFRDRTETLVFGGLVVQLASRFDQICFKLYARVDGGRKSKHVSDLLALAATDAELSDASAWVKHQDIGTEFPRLVDDVVLHIKASRGD
jgi:hypothetical protein